jgi:hypothetical protein
MLLLLASCNDASPTFDEGQPGNIADSPQQGCTISLAEVSDGGVGRDGIPALTDPDLVRADDSGASYVSSGSRVIGIRVGELYIAVPHNILWWHEIVNFDFGDFKLAVTYCPLTGSGIVFDRSVVEDAELGVSGLLFRNNLILYDRRAESSLFPQMMREGACGPETGLKLPLYPSVDITWEGWQRLHPRTRIISGETGWDRPYEVYPYGDYERLNNSRLLFPQDGIDPRRPPKERVLGIPLGTGGGIALPFELLGRETRVVHTQVAQDPVVVFWDPDLQGAIAYLRSVESQTLSFEVRNNKIVDRETESTWNLRGEASEGTLAGERLQQLPEAYVAFWFAWAAFQPETQVWGLE